MESLGGEGGGKGDEGKDGVFSSDSVEFCEYGFGITFGLDGTELGGNNVEGFDDLGGLDHSLFEGSVVISSGLTESLLLFVEDVELLLLVDDVSLQLVDLVLELLDLVAGLGDLVGCEVDSSVITSDFSQTVSLLSSVF